MRRRGFTLLEVMVAMAILAMALVAAFDVVGGALRNHERTRHLELATLLARGKLAELEARFEEEGFRDFDQTEDGSFEEEGHAEVRWSARVVKPTIGIGAEGVVKALTGAEGGLEGLLGLPPSGAGGSGGAGGSVGAGGVTGSGASAAGLLGGAGGAASPLAGMALVAIQGQLVALGEEIKRGVRQLRLTVSWREGAREEQFTVVTHLVVLVPGSQAATGGAAGATGLPPGLTLPSQVRDPSGAGPRTPVFGPPPTRGPAGGSDN